MEKCPFTLDELHKEVKGNHLGLLLAIVYVPWVLTKKRPTENFTYDSKSEGSQCEMKKNNIRDKIKNTNEETINNDDSIKQLVDNNILLRERLDDLLEEVISCNLHKIY